MQPLEAHKLWRAPSSTSACGRRTYKIVELVPSPIYGVKQQMEKNMTHTHETASVETSHRVAPAQRPIPCLPEIPPQFLLKWGLALLGKEKAAEYLAWIQARLNNNSR